VTNSGKEKSLGPTSTARRAGYLRAAREVFLKKGYENGEVDDIIRCSGGSLADFEEHFAGKYSLFAAMIEEIREELVVGLPDVDEEPATRWRMSCSTSGAPIWGFCSRRRDSPSTASSSARHTAARSSGEPFSRQARTPPRPAWRTTSGPHGTGRAERWLPRSGGPPLPRDRQGRSTLPGTRVFGPPPSVGEVDACVRSATRIFLDGVRAGAPRSGR
jgi:AcrR family transcriptional regulator